MSATESTFYVTGGTLRQDAPSYVERQADKDLLDGLLKGEFCYVLTSRQMGKSSLMVRTAGKLREQGVKVVVLDLTAIGQNLTPEQWYDGLLVRMGRQLGLEDELEEFWRAHPQLGPCQRFFAALHDVAMARGSRREEAQDSRDATVTQDQSLLTSAATADRLVLFVDEIDVVRSLPFSTDEFFAALRECYNRRTEDAEFNRIAFCLLGVATPSDLIRDTRLTPFNIGRRVVLNDFTAEEAAPLATGLVAGARAETGSTGDSPVPSGHWPDGTGKAIPKTNAPGSSGATVVPSGGSPLGTGESPVLPGGGATPTAAQALLGRILYWTNGHPYLTQRLCRAVSERNSQRGTDADLPLPSTGRGIEGEGWEEPNASSTARPGADTPLTPALSPLRGDGIHGQHGTARLRTSAAMGFVDELCEELFFSTRAREQDDNLLFVRERLLRGEIDLATLLTHYEQIHHGRRVLDDETNPVVSVLRLSGVVRTEAARLLPRNRIYKRVFDRAWIQANMPDAEVRRQRAAFRRGVIRTSSIALLVVVLISILAAVARNQSRRAQTASRELRQNLYVADMKVALQALDQGHFGQTIELLEKYLPRGSNEDLRGFEWRYLWQASRENSVHTSQAHRDRVEGVSFSADGTLMATASKDRTIKLWDFPSMRELRTIDTGEWVTGVALSLDGALVVSGRFPGRRVELWDVRSGSGIGAIAETGRRTDLTAVAPDGKTIFTSGWDGQVKLWDVASRQITAVLDTGGSNIVRCALAGDGKTAAIGSAAGSITWWDVPTRQRIGALPETARAGYSPIAITPDGHRLAMHDKQYILKVWDLKGPRMIAALPLHFESTRSALAFSPDGKVLAHADGDNRVRLWDYESQEELAVLQGHRGAIQALAFSPDGIRLVSASHDGTFRVWDLARSSGSRPLTGNFADYNISYIAFSPDGRWLAAPGTNNTVNVWDVLTRSLFASLEGHQKPVIGLAFSPDGKTLASSGEEAVVRVWDVGQKQEKFALQAGSRWIPTVAFSPDGSILASGSGSSGREATLWDLTTQRSITTLQGHKEAVMAVAFSPDGKLLATSSGDNTVKLWDVATRRELSTLTGHTDWGHVVAFSPDGKLVASSADDGLVLVWSVSTGQVIKKLPVSADRVGTMAFSPDGQRIATGGYDNVVRLWTVGTWQNTLALRGHTEAVMAVAFSPDGSTLASASIDGTVRLWSAPALAGIDAAEQESRLAR